MNPNECKRGLRKREREGEEEEKKQKEKEKVTKKLTKAS